jgi:hypothetical protein
MGGLAELFLGSQNPIAKYIGSNRQAVRGAFAGFGQGTDFGSGLANAAMYANQGAAADDAYALTLKEKADREAQMQKSIDYLRSSNPKLAELVAAGMDPNQAFAQMLDEMQPAAPTKLEFRDVNGDVLGIDPYTGQSKVVFDGPDATTGDAYTLGPGQVRYGPNNEVLAEGPAKPTGSMDPTTKKELFEAEDAATAGDYVLSALDEVIQLNDKAYDGPFADVRGDGMALLGDEAGIATSKGKNLTTELALSQLKTIFGSMPTEGERKILLELQGSVNQPRQVRAAIYERAKTMAERRIADNKKKASALRSGDYFTEGYGTEGAGDIDSILGGYGL